MMEEENNEVVPIWEYDLAKLDQRTMQTPNRSGPYHIYACYQDHFLTRFDPSLADIILSDTLISKKVDQLKDKLNQILSEWKRGMKLTPPIMIVLDNNVFYPIDGKHRIRVGSFLDRKKVIIIMFDEDKNKLDPDFIDPLIVIDNLSD